MMHLRRILSLVQHTREMPGSIGHWMFTRQCRSIVTTHWYLAGLEVAHAQKAYSGC